MSDLKSWLCFQFWLPASVHPGKQQVAFVTWNPDVRVGSLAWVAGLNLALSGCHEHLGIESNDGRALICYVFSAFQQLNQSTFFKNRGLFSTAWILPIGIRLHNLSISLAKTKLLRPVVQNDLAFHISCGVLGAMPAQAGFLGKLREF